MTDRVRFRLKQGGIPVAWAEGQSALAEITHYAMVYSQDGPVTIEHYQRGKWKRWPRFGHSASIPNAGE